VLTDGTPVKAKLIRYWRGNGDPEPTMYGHVFSPFHRNTLLTDARRLRASSFGDRSGLLGLFYTRAADDPETVEALPERYAAEDIAEKAVRELTTGTESRRACVASRSSTTSSTTSTDRARSSRGSSSRRLFEGGSSALGVSLQQVDTGESLSWGSD